MKTRTVLIMAGGTGGHVFPALAGARELRARGFEVVWLGTQRGLESRLVPPHGIPIEWIKVAGLRGKGVSNWLAGPFRVLQAIWQSLRVMRRRDPDVVLGAGGFVSGPGGIAAWLTRRPLVIHEQNAVAGLTNRTLARVADRVFEAFPASFPASVHAERIGNPVRCEIAALPGPAVRSASRSGALRLLVLGGSQGALKLNVTVPEAIALLPQASRPEIRHQTGALHEARSRAAYTEHGITASLEPFIEDMADAYGWADLVVCRAGALTVSEIAAAGVAAVFVPFAAAVDDHQTRNAGHLVDGGAAVLIAEAEFTARRLASELESLFGAGRARLLAMATRAREFAVTDAASRLADACVVLAGAQR
jgi:UDP-N-acetylglucosamine--N-acetylmuramyl-(pentapeptide) pyrophosphoryl-undecaprenol N-acetylglucosamine transferase